MDHYLAIPVDMRYGSMQVIMSGPQSSIHSIVIGRPERPDGRPEMRAGHTQRSWLEGLRESACFLSRVTFTDCTFLSDVWPIMSESGP